MRTLAAILSVLTMVSTAHATDLSCQLDKAMALPNGDITQVNLMNIEGKDGQASDEGGLSADLPDQGTLVSFQLNPDGGTVGAGFSNECDNQYGIDFDAKEYVAVVDGKLKSISGVLTYEDADSGKLSANINCSVK